MVHTFELSKMISRDTFNKIIASLKLRCYGYYYFTTAYADKGFSAIRLSKFKRKEVKTEKQEDSGLTHYYMISLSINTAHIPCLEPHSEWLNRKKQLNEQWLEENSFKVARIDFTYDLYTMNQQYLTLIDKGYTLRQKSYERNYYDDDEPDISEDEITLSDDEPDMPDIEDFLAEIPNNESSNNSDSKDSTNAYNSDLSYIFIRERA